MKAAIITAINQPLEIVECDPCELQFGQVLVKMSVSGICGAQLSEIRGEKGTHFPRFMGHEGAGVVQAVGIGVKTVKAGDHVICHWRKGAGIESDSPSYILNKTLVTSGQCTTFSEYSICSENRVTAVPDDVPDDLACLMGCGLSTALATIENDAAVKFGESVLVIGCGGLGMNLIQAASLMQAFPIHAMDTNENKETATRIIGAHHFSTNWSDLVSEKYDVIIDTTGNKKAIEMGIRKLADSGRFVMVGQPKPEEWIMVANARHFFEGEGKIFRATQGGGFNPVKDIPRYVNLWRSGAIDPAKIISHRFPLERINEGIELMKEGHASRVMVDMI